MRDQLHGKKKWVEGVHDKAVETGLHFINILLQTFSHKSAIRSFSQIKVWLCNFCEIKTVQKLVVK
jgi:hypothetical protein